jgi:hypothetical protein
MSLVLTVALIVLVVIVIVAVVGTVIDNAEEKVEQGDRVRRP